MSKNKERILFTDLSIDDAIFYLENAKVLSESVYSSDLYKNKIKIKVLERASLIINHEIIRLDTIDHINTFDTTIPSKALPLVK